MRRVFYCGEWIQSHALHIHLLAAPDFLGYDSAPAMARDHPEEVRRGLELQAVGNALIRLFGGRSVDDLVWPQHMNFRFFSMEPLPIFAAHDVMKNPAVDADFARFDAHLDAHIPSVGEEADDAAA